MQDRAGLLSNLKNLRKLQDSPGWRYVSEVMQQEVVAAAMAIASDPKMTLDEINFRRGSIWAASQLVNLPSRLILRLENEEALTKDDRPTSSNE